MACSQFISLSFRNHRASKAFAERVDAQCDRGMSPNPRPSSPQEQQVERPFVGQMTTVFQQNFWSEVTSVQALASPNRELVVRYSGSDFTAELSQAVLLRGRSRQACPEEGDILVLSFLLTFEAPLAEVIAAKERQMGKGSDFNLFRDLVAVSMGQAFIDDFDVGVTLPPGKSNFFLDGPVPAESMVPELTLTAFYHMGWGRFMRLERGQSGLDITPSRDKPLYSCRDIIRQRVELIDLRRRFLGHDRSNVARLREICKLTAEKFQLSKRFDGLSAVHDMLEHHLDNTTKGLQAEKTRAMSGAMRGLACVGVPLGLVATLLAVDLTSTILTTPGKVATSLELLALADASILAVGFFLGLARPTDRVMNRLTDE